MSFLGDLAGKVLGGGGGANLVQIALELLSSRSGGLNGLVQAFQQNGLGNIASSWVGTGQNLPVSVDQLKSVLGGELGQFAQRAGLSHEEAGSQLANLLPNLVDKLTPNGTIPQEGDLLSMGKNLLGQLFSGS